MNWKSVEMQKRSRKIFRLSTFTTARNGFSLFSGCQWVCFFFSSSLLANCFQPANEQSQQKANLVFLYLNSETTISTISFVICRSLKSNKSNFLSFKICEELSAKQTPESQQIQSNRQVKKSRRSGQFVKDFSATESVFFLFYYKP